MCFVICSVLRLVRVLSVYGVLVKEFIAFLLTVDAAEESFDLNLAGQLHDAVDHCLGAWRTTRDEYVNRNYFLNTFCYVI